MTYKLISCVMVWGLLCSHGNAQAGSTKYDRQNVASILGFEKHDLGDLPAGWSGGPAGTVAVDESVVHSGARAIRLDRSDHLSGTFSVVTSFIPIDFAGHEIEIDGFLRTRDVSGFAGLWLREDGDAGTLEFGNMRQQRLSGTNEWKEYSIKLPLNPDARELFFGVLLSGSGIAWGDDLQLVVDGHAINQTPPREKEASEKDTEFDHGTGIRLTQLSSLQADNLVALARVWGFLKYYHPVIVSGERRWDYDLFRILPDMLKANSHNEANTVLAKWIDDLGPVRPCTDCVSLDPTGLKLKPDLAWIEDTHALGKPLSNQLQRIYKNRIRNKQYYVSLETQVQNPSFHHESSYASTVLPDTGLQLLGLFRLWNMIEYWAPYRDLVGENWAAILREFIPRIATAMDQKAYSLEMMAFITKIHDSHANLWSSLVLRPPVGQCRLPIDIRFLSHHAIVTGYTSEIAGKASGFKPGDEILSLDEILLSKLIAGWSPLYAASNEAVQLRDMGRSLTKGDCGPTRVGILRDGARLSLASMRLKPSEAGVPTMTHDLRGPTFRLLSKDIAYLKLSSVRATDIPRYIEQAKNTRGLIIDLRNYPSQFVVFTLGSLFVHQATPFVDFSIPDLSNPGAFHMGKPLELKPAEPHYDGKVVILVDEVSQSQAEYTAMALRSAPNAIILGSTTAGADGNVSEIPLPGDLRTLISGIGVFYPDGAPTQRVGIHVDIEVHPTIAGIRAGRDEILEAAIRQIIPELPISGVQKLAQPVQQ